MKKYIAVLELPMEAGTHSGVILAKAFDTREEANAYNYMMFQEELSFDTVCPGLSYFKELGNGYAEACVYSRINGKPELIIRRSVKEIQIKVIRKDFVSESANALFSTIKKDTLMRSGRNTYKSGCQCNK